MTYDNFEVISEASREYSTAEFEIAIAKDLTDELMDYRNFPPYPYKKMTCDEPVFKIEKNKKVEV